jgi:MFS superfamily sulfate permease-like transporter
MASGPKFNQELAAQGFANTLASSLGGLPMTGVIIRSAVNVQAGGRTRWSAILHGVWFALFALYFPSLMETIPLAALASVLMISGYHLLNVPLMLEKWRTDRVDATIATLTLLAIAATDMLRGLGVGLGVYVTFRLYEQFIRGARKA